jgi:Tfp pilus assembly major pilin PilA
MRTIMNERILFRNHRGFALISIIVALVIICILAVRELPKYFSLDEDKDKVHDTKINMTDGTVPKVGKITDDARNMAGVAALIAATSNVQMVYAKLLVNNMSGTTITNADVVTLLNSSQTIVGDYVVLYSTSGTDKITATLQASSKGKFGTPSSKEIAFR